MKKQITRKIYLLSKKQMRPIEVIQYETGVQLIFEVQDVDLDTSATATLFVRKPSGKFVFQEDDISFEGNTVVINLHNQAITEHGKPFFQIKFKKDDEVISTYSGMFIVEQSLDDSESEESRTVIAAFDAFTDEQIARIEEATQAQIDLMKAEVEAKGKTALDAIPEDFSEMYNKVNTLYNCVANAIRGAVTGSVVRADDVAPVKHNPVVRVHGKNLIPYGTLTFVKNNNCQLANPLPAGTYTISASITSSDTDSELSAVSINSGYEVLKYITFRRNERVSSTFTVAKPITNIDFCAGYNYSQGADDTAIWADIQIEEGTTATEYEPYIDPIAVKVTRCGKNIYQVKAKTQTVNGITFTVNDDGSVTANGTAEKTTFLGLGSLSVKSGEKYRLSGSPAGSAFDTYMLYIHNNTTGADIYDLGEGKVFTAKEGELGLTIVVYAGNTVNNLKFKPMVVYGEENELFEPYSGEVYTPSSNGAVSMITSLSPTMTLLTDKAGVTIECEYTKDTNKVIEKLTNAVSALGGNV